MEYSAIGWTTHTFNPVIGCTKVSAACDFCYAEEHANHYEPLVTWGKPGVKAKLRRTADSNWAKPLSWNRRADKLASQHVLFRQRVFCASLSDVFDSDWNLEWRAQLWDMIAKTPHLDWLLLTKRPQNIASMLPERWGDGWENVWLGTTAENQTEYDRREKHLLAIRAKIHFFSCEPLLGPIDIGDREHGDWYICGGESGPNRRPMNMEWADNLLSQCATRQIPFFFKQDTSLKPGSKGRASDKMWSFKQIPETSRAPVTLL